MGPTWDTPRSCRPQLGPMLAPWTLLSRRFPVSSKTNSRLSSMTDLCLLAFFPISLFHLFITLRPIIFLFLTRPVPDLFLSFCYHMHSLLQWKLLCSESVVWNLFLSAYFNSSLLRVIPWHSFDATIIRGKPLWTFFCVNVLLIINKSYIHRR